MATVNVTTANTFEQWRVKTNELGTAVGNLTNLTEPLAGATNIIAALIVFSDLEISVILSNLSSGTATIPIFGSIVQNGKLAASAFFEAVNALNKVDFPTLGSPTIPHLNPIKVLIYFT